MKTGSCLCGGVAYEITGVLRPVVACHCSQCRKQSGHFGAFTACADPDLKFTSDATLSWYRASDSAGRGFCNRCGSLLFWKGDGRNYTSIAAGSIDGPTDLTRSLSATGQFSFQFAVAREAVFILQSKLLRCSLGFAFQILVFGLCQENHLRVVLKIIRQ
jgi:hypothetical protein